MNISVLSEGDTLEATLDPKEWNASEGYTSDELKGFSINTNWQPISDLNSVSYTSKEGDGSNITSVVDSYFFKTEFILQENKITLDNRYIGGSKSEDGPQEISNVKVAYSGTYQMFEKYLGKFHHTEREMGP